MAEPPSETLPRPFGRYELLRLLGQGGMGRVYEAMLHGPAGFRKRLALKVLRPELGAPSDAARAALVREARLGGLLAHPNVVETWELGELDGQLFIAMALVRGPSVHALVRAHGRLPPRAVLEIGRQTCAGLAHIHGATIDGRPGGIVHRDLKPANLLVDETGVLRIADLGIASFGEATGDLRGTPAYMAPEQLVDGTADRRSDLFALGTILWELTVGRRLFRRSTVTETLRTITGVEELLASGAIADAERYLPGLGAVVRRCLRREPSQRYADARELAEALDGLAVQPLAGAGLFDLLGISEPTATPAPTIPPATADPEASTRVLPIEPLTNLPNTQDPLFGRDADLAALIEVLHGHRLVTVKGAGGTGKTTLVRRFGADQAGAWPGGVWFVDLSTTTTWFGLLHAVAKALGLDLTSGADQTLLDHLGQRLRGRGRLLLLLDNFEQIVDLAPRSISGWLELAPELRVVVTSRERLALPGEEVYELGPLDEASAVALLRARAGQAWAGASIDELVALARALDGLPLALELAAARARLLSPGDLLARLGERFRVLSGGRRGAPDRQATMRGAIAWSWNLLEPWERSALGQLAAFRGGFFLEDAERVLELSQWPDAPWAIDVVGSLWDKSLLVSRSVDRRPRFDMYESIRAFAAEHLDAAAELRHAAHYAGLGPVDPRAACALADRPKGLATELYNLLAAVDRAVAAGQPELAARAALAAASELERTGPGAALAQVVGTALSAQPNGSPWSAVLHVHAAQAALRCGQDRDAATLATRALSVAQGEPLAIARSHLVLAATDMLRGRLDAAEPHVATALELARSHDAARLEGVAVRYLAMVRRRQHRFEEGEALLRRAIDMARAHGSVSELVSGQVSLGALLDARARHDEGVEVLEEALKLSIREGLTHVQSHCHNNLALQLRALGRWEAAFEHVEASLRLDRAAGNRTSEAISLRSLGAMLARSGRYADAVPHLEASAALHRELDQAPAELSTLRVLSVVTTELGRLDRARAAVERAVVLGERVSNARDRHAARCEHAVVQCESGEPIAAAAALEGLLDGWSGEPRCRALLALGRVYRVLGRVEEAEARLREGLELGRGLEESFYRAASALELGGLFAELGRDAEALLDEADVARTQDGIRVRLHRERARAAVVRGEPATDRIAEAVAASAGRFPREEGLCRLLAARAGDLDALAEADRLLAPFPIDRCELAFVRAWLLGGGEEAAVRQAHALGLPRDHARWSSLAR